MSAIRPLRRRRCTPRQSGFSLLEIAVVLVIVGVMMSAVMVGADMLRQAKGQKAFSVFVSGWRDAFNQYVQAAGVVPGDNPGAPTNNISGLFNTPLCDNQPAGPFDLSNAFLVQGIRIPEGNGAQAASQYSYQDGAGSPQTLSVCFVTLAWAVQGNSVNAFVDTPRHVMWLSGLTTELATQMDLLVDGRVSARFGSFRLVGRHSTAALALSPVPDPNLWGDLFTVPGDPESARTLVNAVFEMY